MAVSMKTASNSPRNTVPDGLDCQRLAPDEEECLEHLLGSNRSVFAVVGIRIRIRTRTRVSSVWRLPMRPVAAGCSGRSESASLVSASVAAFKSFATASTASRAFR